MRKVYLKTGFLLLQGKEVIDGWLGDLDELSPYNYRLITYNKYLNSFHVCKNRDPLDKDEISLEKYNIYMHKYDEARKKLEMVGL